MTTSQPSKTARSPGVAGFETHDHAVCVNSALEAAEQRCADEALRFTPVRRKVLEVLLKEHRALGAYAILDALRDAGFGSQPPVAYRALEFLTAHGFAHKIQRLNAFVACSHLGESHSPTFLICRACDAVAEARGAPARDTLVDEARAVGFQVEKITVEAEGVCPACAKTTTG